MGDHNRTYLSQGWTGADGKQIVRRTARVMRSVGPALFATFLEGVLLSPAFARLTFVMSCAGRRDLTPRRGLVYDALGFEFSYALSEGGMRRGR